MEIYSTCPISYGDPARFRQQIVDVARWTEASSCRGLLVYTDNNLIDPWAATQLILSCTERVAPLVAVQPAYMGPFTAARMVSSLGFLYGRALDLNFVAGGQGSQLRAIGSPLEHDERYQRLVEYATIVRGLLAGGEPLIHHGAYYSLVGAMLQPPFDPALAPRVYVSGSSPASQAAGRALGAVRLTYPRAVAEYADDPAQLHGAGIRLGIIARADREEAWREAHRRFPPNPSGERMHDAAKHVSDSRWHARLDDDYAGHAEPDTPYWLYPFRAYRTFCPYLVGSYAEVGAAIAEYRALGVRTLILDVPHDPDDLPHTELALLQHSR